MSAPAPLCNAVCGLVQTSYFVIEYMSLLMDIQESERALG